MYERKISFAVPAERVDDVRAAIEQSGLIVTESVNYAQYFDTDDAQLASRGITLSVTNQAGQWLQSATAIGDEPLKHWRADSPLDSTAPDLITAARRLSDAEPEIESVLKKHAEQISRQFELSAEVTRAVATASSGSLDSAIELNLVCGELRAGSHSMPVLVLEFGLLRGDLYPMLLLAQRWQQQLSLIYLPLPPVVQGMALVRGEPLWPVRDAQSVLLTPAVTVARGADRLFDECFSQVAINLCPIALGVAGVDHRHQTRVGLRRLRSVLRLFQDWLPSVADADQDQLVSLARDLGAGRDYDVLTVEIAPRIAHAAGEQQEPITFVDLPEPDLSQAAGDAQSLLMSLLVWRHRTKSAGSQITLLHPLVQRRIGRWLSDVRRRSKRFKRAGVRERHTLRKRIKRARYAGELVTDLLPRREMRRCTKRVFSQQAILGQWCDLVMARELIQTETSPRTEQQFALGWLAGQAEALEPRLLRSIRRCARYKSRL